MLALLALFALLYLVHAIPTISIKGSKFFTSDGDQFYIKGVAYQPHDDEDFNGLTNGAQCAIDAKLIADLGANVVRVYSADPTLNHDDCMTAFAEHGIYVIVDVTTAILAPYTLNRADPKWTIELRDTLVEVIDGFHDYNNTFAFFVANEFVDDQKNSDGAVYAKAMVSDMKAYRDLMQYRAIPIGYSAADVDSIRTETKDFFSCGPANTSVDFYAYNKYSWCGDVNFVEAGYDTLYQEAAGFDMPIFLSETGCRPSDDINITVRDFADQVALLGRDMNDRYSGSIIYEWVNHNDNYGLVSYANDAATGTPSLMDDYTRLKSQWARLEPTGVKESAYSADGTKRACPTSTAGGWLVDQNAALPTLGIKGFTAPTGSRTGVREGAGSTASSTNGANANNPSGGSKTPIGAIAGGVLGGLVVLALLLGGILILLRRKRKQRAAAATEQGKSQQNGYNGYYELNPQELPGHKTPELYGHDMRHELAPGQGKHASMSAAEMTDQRGSVGAGTATQGEMRRGEKYLAQSGDGDGGGDGLGVSPTGNGSANLAPSPFVQRQMDMEMEWLESEEQRLRERRELLRRQNGGKGS